MAPAPRGTRPLYPACAASLAILALLGCSRDRLPAGDWPLGFHLPVDPAYHMSAGLRRNGEGSVFFISGDEPDAPRLVVRRHRLRRTLEEILEDELALGPESRVLERGEPFDARAVNAAGVGVRQVVMPFADFDSTLVLLFDTRVFLVGDWAYSLVWQQPPADSALTRRYEGWLTALRFQPEAEAPQDTADREEDGGEGVPFTPTRPPLTAVADSLEGSGAPSPPAAADTERVR